MGPDPAAERELRVLPGDRRVAVAAGQSLLHAALQAGVQLPSSCRNGTCRACMCRLVAGRIRYRIEWPGLLAEEKAEGWILPCVAEPESPLVVIELPSANQP